MWLLSRISIVSIHNSGLLSLTTLGKFQICHSHCLVNFIWVTHIIHKLPKYDKFKNMFYFFIFSTSCNNESYIVIYMKIKLREEVLSKFVILAASRLTIAHYHPIFGQLKPKINQMSRERQWHWPELNKRTVFHSCDPTGWQNKLKLLKIIRSVTQIWLLNRLHIFKRRMYIETANTIRKTARFAYF